MHAITENIPGRLDEVAGVTRRSDSKVGQHLPLGLLVLFSVAWLLLAIRPVDRSTWLFENLPVFALLPVLICTYKRFRFSNLSYVLLAVVLTLHAIGAHYTYSETPIGNWFRENLGLARNHYDRLLHLFFGLLITFSFWEYIHRELGLSARFSALIAGHSILAWSGVYELLEALVAYLVNPALGAAYNGTQGDEWDAQKDMGLALLGSVITVLVIAISGSHRANKRRGFTKAREAAVESSGECVCVKC